MFNIYESSDAASALGLCDDVLADCCFPRRLRSVNFAYSSTWKTPYAEREI
jgi:hypothetical protein